MFRRVSSVNEKMLTLYFEGEALTVRSGLTIAAALLETGFGHFRYTSGSGSARAPFCMMGVCFDCLLEIDGRENQQSCMIEVQQGMQIKRQSGTVSSVSADDNRVGTKHE